MSVSSLARFGFSGANVLRRGLVQRSGPFKLLLGARAMFRMADAFWPHVKAWCPDPDARSVLSLLMNVDTDYGVFQYDEAGGKKVKRALKYADDQRPELAGKEACYRQAYYDYPTPDDENMARFQRLARAIVEYESHFLQKPASNSRIIEDKFSEPGRVGYEFVMKQAPEVQLLLWSMLREAAVHGREKPSMVGWIARLAGEFGNIGHYRATAAEKGFEGDSAKRDAVAQAAADGRRGPSPSETRGIPRALLLFRDFGLGISRSPDAFDSLHALVNLPMRAPPPVRLTAWLRLGTNCGATLLKSEPQRQILRGVGNMVHWVAEGWHRGGSRLSRVRTTLALGMRLVQQTHPLWLHRIQDDGRRALAAAASNMTLRAYSPYEIEDRQGEVNILEWVQKKAADPAWAAANDCPTPVTLEWLRANAEWIGEHVPADLQLIVRTPDQYNDSAIYASLMAVAKKALSHREAGKALSDVVNKLTAKLLGWSPRAQEFCLKAIWTVFNAAAGHKYAIPQLLPGESMRNYDPNGDRVGPDGRVIKPYDYQDFDNIRVDRNEVQDQLGGMIRGLGRETQTLWNIVLNGIELIENEFGDVKEFGMATSPSGRDPMRPHVRARPPEHRLPVPEESVQGLLETVRYDKRASLAIRHALRAGVGNSPRQVFLWGRAAFNTLGAVTGIPLLSELGEGMGELFDVLQYRTAELQK